MFVRIYNNNVIDIRDISPVGFYPSEVCEQYKEFPNDTAAEIGWTYDEIANNFVAPDNKTDLYEQREQLFQQAKEIYLNEKINADISGGSANNANIVPQIAPAMMALSETETKISGLEMSEYDIIIQQIREIDNQLK